MKLTIDGKPVKWANDVIEQLLKELYEIQTAGSSDSGSVFVSRLVHGSKVGFTTLMDVLPYLELMRKSGLLEPARHKRRELPLDVMDKVRLTPDGIQRAEWLLASPLKRHLKEYVGLAIESITVGIGRLMLDR